MINLETSKVLRLIANNMDLCNKPGRAGAPAIVDPWKVNVGIVKGRNVVTASLNGAVFAGVYTKAGWRALPAMTSLAGKRLYTDDEAEAAVKALFAAASDARKPTHISRGADRGEGRDR